MARIRTIKPEFWTAEQVMECSPTARLLFIGMWNFCDDGGNHPASAKTLKAEIFPGDDITADEVQAMVDDLVANDLLQPYTAGGKQYLHVTGWHHQKIEKPNFKHPKPEIRQSVGDQSATDRQSVGDQSATEWSRKGIGKEGSKPVAPSSVVVDSTEGAREVTPPAALPATTLSAAPDPEPTRRGVVCRLLRQAGVSDAAPHHLTDETWAQILSKRTDEEIVEFARAKLESRPGQRTGLKYLAPGLLEDPAPLQAPNARGSPHSRTEQLNARNQAAIAQAKAAILAREAPSANE
jgi:hypothetical protein